MIPNAFHYRNTLQVAVLVGGMLGILALTGWILFGDGGAMWALILVGGALIWLPSAAPALLLKLYRARPLSSRQVPAVYHALAELCRRAGVPHVPVLYHLPTNVLNAFTVGSGRNAVIAVSDAMLRNLDMRELINVLAHEVGHIAGSDVRVMTFADVISRITALLSTAGNILLLFNIPLLLLGEVTISWFLVPILILAPNAVMLLQLALSRTREFDADEFAARIAGDPEGLAVTLHRLERSGGSVWERLFAPGKREEQPSFLRTHPPTRERARRLLEMAAQMQTGRSGRFWEPLYLQYRQPVSVPARTVRIPRWRLAGLWY
ncbi:zinc metalloprotease HtpX [Oleidesulfovibrio sp.]|uniref:zinc metalloprotease HtpX n=1 Tax=Oleidesulfovibrio sp. TaxID=2909707 RepID=UPI003A8C0FDC